jgi:hypothetical protein
MVCTYMPVAEYFIDLTTPIVAWARCRTLSGFFAAPHAVSAAANATVSQRLLSTTVLLSHGADQHGFHGSLAR